MILSPSTGSPSKAQGTGREGKEGVEGLQEGGVPEGGGPQGCTWGDPALGKYISKSKSKVCKKSSQRLLLFLHKVSIQTMTYLDTTPQSILGCGGISWA